MAKPTKAQLAALAEGRRKQAAAKAAAASAPEADAPVAAAVKRSAPKKRTASVTWGWVAGLIIVAVMAWLFFAAVRPRALSPAGDLVRWVPGPPWRFRDGQYIAPAAAAALAQIADDLGNDEACQPMTLDISREGGGPFPPHKSHQTGVDVDIRMSDIGTECRNKLQNALALRGWLTWYNGPDAGPPGGDPSAFAGRQHSDGRHITHLHARLAG